MKQILFDNNIFSKLYNINEELPLELREAFLTKNFNEIIEVISQTYPAETSTTNIFFRDFIYFGHLNLKEENFEENKIFEFYMHGLNSSKGIYYEFMINDVTKTKMVEVNRLKEKTLILGKISHEFKNPIIVMEEVIDQIIDNGSSNLQNPNEIQAQYSDKLNFIKNLCQYMI